jgi:hypothetical protein
MRIYGNFAPLLLSASHDTQEEFTRMGIEGQISFQDVISRSSRMDVALSAAFMRTARAVSPTSSILTLHTIRVKLALGNVSVSYVTATASV